MFGAMEAMLEGVGTDILFQFKTINETATNGKTNHKRVEGMKRGWMSGRTSHGEVEFGEMFFTIDGRQINSVTCF